MKSDSRTGNLLQSGIIFSAISFVTGLGNLAFQGVLGRHLSGPGQYGNANSALGGLMTLLGLLPAVATFAVTHYIAHFNASGDSARLQGLLLGCRKFLFRFTIIGSVLAMIVTKPLSDFFHYDESLMLVTLGCALLGLWASLATALCQGLAWFKRLALIGFLAMLLRVCFGWLITFKWPSAETAVLASAFALLANLVLLFWRKDLSLHGEPVPPWNREFAQYFIVSAAFVAGNFCFFQGDYLVANKFFTKEELDAYAAAGILAIGLAACSSDSDEAAGGSPFTQAVRMTHAPIPTARPVSASLTTGTTTASPSASKNAAWRCASAGSCSSRAPGATSPSTASASPCDPCAGPACRRRRACRSRRASPSRVRKMPRVTAM